MARVLVIDDDADLLETIRETLSRAGHEVFVASSAPGGVREYRQRGADVIVTDLFVPDIDGLALIRELASEVKIIAISGGGPFAQRDLLALIAEAAAH